MNQNSRLGWFRFDLRLALSLVGWLAACFLAASLGAVFMPGDWYAMLKKPSWNPPAWIFGPVWTTLYAMMAVAAWLVWKRGGFAARRIPLALFLAQLVLNAAWTPLFFGLHQLGFACAEIVSLWLLIAATLAAFRPLSRAAAWLLAPYLAWVSFAAALNFAVWRLNS
ncbi:MAG TPA: TspO/MBR family protein [Candidatus Acidoferrum sp.]|nr:TspO/MBR family protein [Candidatus Acidoferrum sp.]